MTDLLTLAVPFFLIFAIVYGGLEVAGLFKQNKKLNAVIALVLGFFAITSEQVVALIYAFVPYVSILFIVVFILGFVLAPFRGKEEPKDFSLILVVAVLITLFLASQGEQILADIFPFLGMPGENFFALAGLLLIIAIFYAAYQHSKGERK